MDAVVLTSENSAEFYARKLDLEPPAAPAKAAEPVVESEKVVEADKPVDEADDKQVPNTEARQRLNARFSELTERSKAAQAEAEKARTDAKAANDARVLAEQRAAELQAKYEPPKPDELGPEPTREQFVNDAEFIAAVKDHAADKALRERDQKESQDKIAKAWSERQAATKAEIPTYDADIAKSSNLMVSNEVRAAILESDAGPKILHHLAVNPDLVSQIAKMSVPAAMIAIGRLDAKFSAPQAEPVKAAAPAPVASEPSRAPATIDPVRGASAVEGASVNGDGVFYGTFAQYKAQRKAGKIK